FLHDYRQRVAFGSARSCNHESLDCIEPVLFGGANRGARLVVWNGRGRRVRPIRRPRRIGPCQVGERAARWGGWCGGRCCQRDDAGGIQRWTCYFAARESTAELQNGMRVVTHREDRGETGIYEGPHVLGTVIREPRARLAADDVPMRIDETGHHSHAMS